jgi:hypothetical protein
MIDARADEAKRITKKHRDSSEIERCKRLLFETLRVLRHEDGARVAGELAHDIAATLRLRRAKGGRGA